MTTGLRLHDEFLLALGHGPIMVGNHRGRSKCEIQETKDQGGVNFTHLQQLTWQKTNSHYYVSISPYQGCCPQKDLMSLD